MTDREIMQQALEALTRIWEDGLENYPVWAHEAAIDNLRERLAQPEQEPLQFKCTIVDDAHPNGVPLSRWGKQPEQEPVACRFCGDDRGCWAWQCNHCGEIDDAQEPAPPQRKKLPPQTPCLLTQAEGKMFRFGWLECEAAHGIKENT